MSLSRKGLMRKPKKATLRNTLVTKKVDIDPNLLHILDGGALLHKVRWPTSFTFEDVCKLYVDHITSKHGISTIVFEGYSDTPSTKDHEHVRRSINKRGCVDVHAMFQQRSTLNKMFFHQTVLTNLVSLTCYQVT